MDSLLLLLIISKITFFLPTLSNNIYSSYQFTTTDTIQVYVLPHKNIFIGSEKVYFQDSLLIIDKDYQIDYNLGRLNLITSFPDSSIITIFYKYFPLDLKDEYKHRVPIVESDSADTSIKYQTSNIKYQALNYDENRLEVGGSKTITIDVGSNKDMSLDQSLRVNINGQITKDVEINAILSDQSASLQPEGDTEELDDIEKIFVEVKSKNLSATVGDYNIDFTDTEFGQFSRRLTGARTDGNFLPLDFTVAGAISKGNFTTNQFNGIEGKQGPYQLYDESGNSDIIVIGGTEKVWVDNILMKRGANQDYIIEYSNGTIVFTNKRLITSQSRIVVDFEYTNLRYKRNTYIARSKIKFKNGLFSLGTSFIQESDSKNKPIETIFTQQDSILFVNSGDNPVRKSGIDSVGYDPITKKGRGNYRRVKLSDTQIYCPYINPSLTYIYQFVPERLRDSTVVFNVSFRRIGQGLGNYTSYKGTSADSIGCYIYTCEGQGDYVVVDSVSITPPISHSIADFSIDLNLFDDGKPTLTFSNELATSQRDNNTFSKLDDSDNNGLAYKGNLSFMSGKTKFGEISLSAKYRWISSNFRPISRLETVANAYSWSTQASGDTLAKEKSNLQSTPEEKRYEINTLYKPLPFYSVGASFGKRNREYGKLVSDSKNSIITKKESLNKIEANTRLFHLSYPNLEYSFSNVNEESNIGDTLSLNSYRIQQYAKSFYAFFKFKPSINYLYEKVERSKTFLDSSIIKGKSKGGMGDSIYAGSFYNEYGSGLSLVNIGVLSTSSNYSVRKNHIFSNNKWIYESLSRTQTHTININEFKGLYWYGEYTHRIKEYKDVKVSDKSESPKTDLIKTETNYLSPNRNLLLNFYYQVANTEFVSMYDYNPNTGAYSYNLQGEPTTDLTANALVEIRGKNQLSSTKKPLPIFSTLYYLLSFISTETYLNIEENSTLSDRWAIYSFRKLQQDSLTNRGNLTFKQSLNLFPDNNMLSLRFRYEENKNMNFSKESFYGNKRQNVFTRSVQLQTSYFSNLPITSEYEKKDSNESSDIRGKIEESESNKCTFNISHKPIAKLKISLKLEQERKSIVRPADAVFEWIKLTNNVFSPQCEYSFLFKSARRKPNASSNLVESFNPSGKCRMVLEYTYNRLNSSTKNILPLTVLSGKEVGITHLLSCNFSYRINEYITTSLDYTGKVEPNRNSSSYKKTEHRMKMEARAYF